MRSTKSVGSSPSQANVCSQRDFRVFSRAVYLTLLVCLMFACSGCSLTTGMSNYLAYNDNSNDFVMGWRNSVWARQAWHNQNQEYEGHPEFRAFGAGYRDGYRAVASGGNGCPPPVPPRQYWTWKYQTSEGQAKVAAWFEGYPYGARAAEQDGAGYYQDIQVSYLIETQYSPEFQAGQLPYLGPSETILPGQPADTIPLEPIPGGAPQAPRGPPQAPRGAPQAVAPHARPLIPVSWNQPISGNVRRTPTVQPNSRFPHQPLL